MIQRVREAIRRHVYLTVSLLTVLLLIILGGVATACFGGNRSRPQAPLRPVPIARVPVEPGDDDEGVLGDSYLPPHYEPAETPPTQPIPDPEPIPVPLPVPADPIVSPPIHVDPPIIVDPPYPLPCGGCGAGAQAKNIICPMTMHSEVSVQICRLDI